MKTTDPVCTWDTPTASGNAPLCFNSLCFPSGARAGFRLDLFSLTAVRTDIPLLPESLYV